jgi:hypothetical protein
VRTELQRDSSGSYRVYGEGEAVEGQRQAFAVRLSEVASAFVRNVACSDVISVSSTQQRGSLQLTSRGDRSIDYPWKDINLMLSSHADRSVDVAFPAPQQYCGEICMLQTHCTPTWCTKLAPCAEKQTDKQIFNVETCTFTRCKAGTYYITLTCSLLYHDFACMLSSRDRDCGPSMLPY